MKPKDNELNSKEAFLYPVGNYHGDFTLNNLAFDANLQEFAQKSAYICSLEANGKVSPSEAFDRIKLLWKELKESKKNLLDNTDFTSPAE